MKVLTSFSKFFLFFFSFVLLIGCQSDNNLVYPVKQVETPKKQAPSFTTTPAKKEEKKTTAGVGPKVYAALPIGIGSSSTTAAVTKEKEAVVTVPTTAPATTTIVKKEEEKKPPVVVAQPSVVKQTTKPVAKNQPKFGGSVPVHSNQTPEISSGAGVTSSNVVGPGNDRIGVVPYDYTKGSDAHKK